MINGHGQAEKLIICHLHFTQADQISPKSKADPLPWWLKAD
jgi:hypothetical protein